MMGQAAPPIQPKNLEHSTMQPCDVRFSDKQRRQMEMPRIQVQVKARQVPHRSKAAAVNMDTVFC